MIVALACGHHQDKSRTMHFLVAAAQNKALGPLIGGVDVRFVQHEHPLLVKAFENRVICTAFSSLHQITPDGPERSIFS